MLVCIRKSPVISKYNLEYNAHNFHSFYLAIMKACVLHFRTRNYAILNIEKTYGNVEF